MCSRHILGCVLVVLWHQGDYYRYLSEVEAEGSESGVIGQAQEAYEAATAAAASMEPTDPIRLGLALNVSGALLPPAVHVGITTAAQCDRVRDLPVGCVGLLALVTRVACVAVFYYEILKQPEKAIETAKGAFDDAIAKLDALNDADYKDATLIMQLIRDNLTLWASDDRGDEDDA